jgi:hypothetical protein
MALTNCAKVGIEEVVTPKSDKGPNLLSCTHRFACLLKDQLYGCSQIIVADAVGNSSKVLEGLHVCPQETFLFLGGKGHDKGSTGVTEAHDEELHSLVRALNDSLSLSPIDLCILARLKFQGKKNIRDQTLFFALGDILPDAGFTALIACLTQNLKDFVRGVALFYWKLLVLLEQSLYPLRVRAKDWRWLGASQLIRFGRVMTNNSPDGVSTVPLFSGDLVDTLLLQKIGASDLFLLVFIEHGHGTQTRLLLLGIKTTACVFAERIGEQEKAFVLLLRILSQLATIFKAAQVVFAYAQCFCRLFLLPRGRRCTFG